MSSFFQKPEHKQSPVSLEHLEHLASKRIEELLVESGLINKEDLTKALQVKAKQGGETLHILISLGCLSVEQFLQFLATLPKGSSFFSDMLSPKTEMARLIPQDLALTYKIFPIDETPEGLILGGTEPLSESDVSILENIIGRPIKVVVCSKDDVREAINHYYVKNMNISTPALEQNRTLAAFLRLSLVSKLLQEIEAFPALPETVTRVRQVMGNRNSSIRDVAEIIELDPPIAAKILSVANSAAYGFPRQVDDLTLAITLLGLRETYSIVLSVAVLNFLKTFKTFNYKKFWLESICSAAATRFVLKAAKSRSIPGVFAGALLHDIGQVALAAIFPGLSRRLDAELKGSNLLEAEEKLFGINHAELGYLLASHWQLPLEIIEAIRFHHYPENATTAQETVAAVAIAQALGTTKGKTLEDNRELLVIHRDNLKILGIDLEAGEAMIADFLERRDDSLRQAFL